MRRTLNTNPDRVTLYPEMQDDPQTVTLAQFVETADK